MKINQFEDIIAWQKAQDLAVVIYHEFKNLKDYSFKNQIQSAAVSISNNIAEGFERSSDKEFIRFLNIAAASCCEVRSMLHLAVKLSMINIETSKTIIDNTLEVNKLIYGFIKVLNR